MTGHSYIWLAAYEEVHNQTYEFVLQGKMKKKIQCLPEVSEYVNKKIHIMRKIRFFPNNCENSRKSHMGNEHRLKKKVWQYLCWGKMAVLFNTIAKKSMFNKNYMTLGSCLYIFSLKTIMVPSCCFVTLEAFETEKKLNFWFWWQNMYV